MARFGGPARPGRQLRLGLAAAVSALSFLGAIGVTPASAADTGISGMVTDAPSGHGVADVEVDVYDSTGTSVNSTCTGTGGTYTFGGLQVGTYRVGFESTSGTFKVCGGKTNYLPQFYNDKTTLAAASSVPVISGATTPNVDAALNPGGAIAGTVTDATTTQPIENVEVDAYNAGGNLVSSTCTDKTGDYSLFALANGAYRVDFLDSTACGTVGSYKSQYYKSEASLATAQPVPVSVSATTSGISAALSPTDPNTLKVTVAGNGSGTAKATPPASSCATTCSYPFTPGSSVSLTATAAHGSKFTGWSGGGCSGTGACTVKMTGAESVTATFKKQTGTSTGPPSSRVSCRLSVKSRRVLLKAGRGRASKAKLDRVFLSYKCNQAAKLALSGTVTEQVKHRHHKSGKKTFRIRVMHARARASSTGVLTVKLPAGATRALLHKAKESASFTLGASNSRGSSRKTVRVARLRGMA